MGVAPDCYCREPGSPPRCPPCITSAAAQMRRDHPDTLSVSMLKRRLPDVTPHEAALLLEASRWVLTVSLAHETRRNGSNGRYVASEALETKARPRR
jgi:hypothetical protein